MIACTRDKLSKSKRKDFFNESSQWEIYLAISSDSTIIVEITLTLQLALKELAWVLERVQWHRKLWQTHAAKTKEVWCCQDYIASSTAFRTAKSADTKSDFCKAPEFSAINIPSICPVAALFHPLNLFLSRWLGKCIRHKALMWKYLMGPLSSVPCTLLNFISQKL